MLVISKNILFSKVKIDSLCESNPLGLLESLKWAGKRVIPYSHLVWSFEPPGRQQIGVLESSSSVLLYLSLLQAGHGMEASGASIKTHRSRLQSLLCPPCSLQ